MCGVGGLLLQSEPRVYPPQVGVLLHKCVQVPTVESKCEPDPDEIVAETQWREGEGKGNQRTYAYVCQSDSQEGVINQSHGMCMQTFFYAALATAGPWGYTRL